MKNYTKYILLALGITFLASCRSASKSCGLASTDVKVQQIINQHVTDVTVKVS